ncbi:putative Innexin inx3 [Daphnia magna]|uniref:Innexin n=1 Tax=Daphnia magna TaxID=35525 RepID=A0A164TF69_9CRUS|nr:putative Innexin inx3 [Daphnia magna]
MSPFYSFLRLLTKLRSKCNWHWHGKNMFPNERDTARMRRANVTLWHWRQTLAFIFIFIFFFGFLQFNKRSMGAPGAVKMVLSLLVSFLPPNKNDRDHFWLRVLPVSTCNQPAKRSTFNSDMSVARLLSVFATLLKVTLLQDKPVVDNAIFRLHYRFTCVFFLAASVLVTAIDLFGKPIDCIGDVFPQRRVLNTYCWIQHTFTVPFESHQIHPCVGPPSSEKRYHSYYQWVPFVLFFQGLLFYLPHWIWKQHENGIVGQLTEGRRGFDLKGRDATLWRPLLSSYLNETMGTHGYLGVAHVTCELFNLVNAVGNIYLIDLFLGGYFFDYGWQILQRQSLDQEERRDHMIEIFPRVTKCTLDTYGSSGSVQRHDALCILPVNVLNEKIYIFAWFWLVFLAVVSLFALLYRLLVMTSPAVRHLVFKRIGSTTSDPQSMAILSRRLAYPDCYLVFLLGKNLQDVAYRDLLDDLAHHLDHSHLNC